jgi:iron complex outermembrane receptor protein
MPAYSVRREGSADLGCAIALAIAVCALAPASVRAADPPPAADPAAPGDPAAPRDPAAAPDPAGAPLAAPTAPVRQVGEVTAHATRGEREVLDVPGNVTVIDREEIERSGVRSVPELLRREAGIFVTNTSTSPTDTVVDARGFNNGGGNGASLLVLVDGRRATEPDTGSADWALLPLEMVESIEIVRGPASALYGDGAVGGVLHIRTRPVEGPPRAAVRGLYGRYDTAGGSLRASGSFGDLTAGLLVDGLTTDAYRKRAAFDSQDAKLSLEGTLFERVVLGSSGRYHHDDRELPGGLTATEIAELGRRAAAPFATKDRADVDAWAWDGWAEAALAEGVELRLLPYYFTRHQFSRQSGTSFGGFTAEIDTDKDQGGVDLQITVERAIFDLESRLIAGATYLHDDVHRTSESTGLFAAIQRTRGERDVAGGFLQEELSLRKDLLLSAGVRYDAADYQLRRTDAFSSERDSPRLHAWSPKASLSWRFLPAASAYLAYARAFRMPDFDEDVPVFGPLPDLEPLRSDSYEVGAKLEMGRASAGVSLYWMSVHDEILLDPETFANLNLDRVRHRGIELAGSFRPLAWLTILGSYTFDDVEIVEDADPQLEGARIPITPRHRGTIGAFAELPLGLPFLGVDLGLNANLVGSRIVANDFQREVSKLDPYQTLDVWVRLRPELGEHYAATFSFAVRNATGEHYEGYAACGCLLPLPPGIPPGVAFYPAATRTYEVGVRIELAP